jgi:hypothetical protein
VLLPTADKSHNNEMCAYIIFVYYVPSLIPPILRLTINPNLTTFVTAKCFIHTQVSTVRMAVPKLAFMSSRYQGQSDIRSGID